jgi:hypothetical protein
MDPKWEENRIKEMFTELRRHDDARAPDFATVWGAATVQAGREHRRKVMRLTVATAMAVAVGIIFSVILVENRAQRTRQVFSAHRGPGESRSFDLPWKTSVLICEWRSPTDFLLRTPAELSSLSPVPSPENK